MENFKCKVLGRFPTRCVGCLLALVILLSSFSCSAMELSTPNYPLNVSTLASMQTMYTQAKQLNHSIFLLYSPTNQQYFFVSWKSPATSENSNAQFFMNSDTTSAVYNYFYFYIKDTWNNFYYGTANSGYGYVYSLYSINNVWVSETITEYSNAYNDKAYYYDFPDDVVLIAADMNPLFYDSYNHEILVFYTGFSPNHLLFDVSNIHLEYYENFELKYDFANDGTLVDSEGVNVNPNPNYTSILDLIVSKVDSILSGITGLPNSFSTAIGNIQGWLSSLGTSFSNAIGNIQGWLSSLGTSLSNAIGNIQGWLSSLGSSIGDFFSNLWTNLGTRLSNMWSSLSTWFSNLTTNIYNYFVGLVNDIKSLFIPESSFWTTYNTNFNEMFDRHFGGLLQAEVVLQDLIGIPPSTNRSGELPYFYRRYSIIGKPYTSRFIRNNNTRDNTEVFNTSLLDVMTFEQVDSYEITVPRLRFRIPSINNIRFYTIYEGGTFDLADLFSFYGGTSSVYDFRELFNIAVNCLMFIYGLYHLKHILDEFIGKKGYYDL